MHNNNNKSTGGMLLLAFAPFCFAWIIQILASVMCYELVFWYCVTHCRAVDYVGFLRQFFDTMINNTTMMNLSIVYALVGIIIFSIWYIRGGYANRERLKHPFKPSVDRRGLCIAGLLVTVIGLLVLVQFIYVIASTIRPDWYETLQRIQEMSGLTDELTILTIIYGMVLGPIFEELTFRGLTFKIARAVTPFWIANVLQAFLFACMHANMLQGIYAFVVGLVFGFIMEKSNNVLITMGMHILYNTLAMVIGSLLDQLSGSQSPVIFGGALFMSMVITYLGIYMFSKSYQPKVN